MAKVSNKCWIQDIKVNPNGQKVVFGTHGGLSKIEVASIKPDGTLFGLKQINAGISSALLSIDWSTAGDSVVLNS